MNFKRFIILGTLLCLLVSSTVLADSFYKTYELPKTGSRNFKGIDNSANYKETNWNSWWVSAIDIHYNGSGKLKTGWGIAYTPMIKTGERYRQAGGNTVWINNPSGEWYFGSWNGNGHNQHYYLGARVDDVFNGNYGSARGYWNTDAR